MTLKVCKKGHPLEGNRAQNGSCLTCRRIYSRSRRKEHAAYQREWKKKNPEKAKANNRRMHQNRAKKGITKMGYTKNVLINTGEEKMRQAFAIVHETGDIRDVWQLLTKTRWWAIRSFFPMVGKQMDTVILGARHARKQQVVVPAKPAIIRATNLELVGRINNAVSRYLSRDHRDDVIGDMVEAVLSGKLKPGDIEKDAAKFVRDRFRIDHNKFGDLSLDVPIWTDSETNLFDIIPDEQALWR